MSMYEEFHDSEAWDFYDDDRWYDYTPTKWTVNHHKAVKYLKVIHKTDTAMLLEIAVNKKRLELWIPKAIIKEHNGATITVHTKTYDSIVQKKLDWLNGIPLWKL